MMIVNDPSSTSNAEYAPFSTFSYCTVVKVNNSHYSMLGANLVIVRIWPILHLFIWISKKRNLSTLYCLRVLGKTYSEDNFDKSNLWIEQTHPRFAFQTLFFHVHYFGSKYFPILSKMYWSRHRVSCPKRQPAVLNLGGILTTCWTFQLLVAIEDHLWTLITLASWSP